MYKQLPNRIALTLWGWGARGLAHVWVLRYLEEHHIQIEEISGTSAWAIVGAMIAYGMNSQDIVKILDQLNIVKLADINLRTGFLKGEKIRAYFETLFGDTQIQDLKIPLAISATDINTGEQIILRSWSIVDALRASVSIPGIFAPYERDGRTLVDGWVIENLPISLVQWTNIIAVSTRVDLTKKIKTRHKLFGISMRKSFFAVNAQIIQKTISLLVRQNEDRSLFEASSHGKHVTFVNPNADGSSIYQFSHYPKLIQAGRDAMAEIFGDHRDTEKA